MSPRAPLLLVLAALTPACAAEVGDDMIDEADPPDQEPGGDEDEDTLAGTTPTLRVSVNNDRSSARALEGARVARSIYVFVAPTDGIVRVRFYVDGALRHTENHAPFDLGGTGPRPARVALPFDTRTLSKGLHAFRADVDRCAAGCTRTVRALAYVDNTVHHPKSFGVAAYWPDGPAGIGARWVRQGFSWAGHQPSAGAAIVPLKDSYVVRAQENGQKVIGVLAYAPRWARSEACKDHNQCEPVSAALYVDWVRAMVRHYKDVGPTHARVHAWELWNEENSDYFWQPAPNPVLYAEMVKGAYDAIKAEDPGALVVLGGFSGAPSYLPEAEGSHVMDPRRFLARLYQNGIAGHYDAVVHHPYTWSNPNRPVDQASNWTLMYQDATIDTPDGPVLAKSLRRQMVEHGDGDKPIWNTEFGAPSPVTLANGMVIDEQKQADLMVEAMDLWKTYSWSGVFIVFNYMDFDSAGARRDDHMGIIRSTDGAPGCDAAGRPTGTAKKAYCAFQAYAK